MAGQTLDRWNANLLIGVLFLAGASGAGLLTGCGDEDIDEDGLPNPIAVITLASDVSIASIVGLQEYGLVRDTPGSLLCPLVQVFSDTTGPRGVDMEYGTGCTSDLDGTESAGLITATFVNQPLPIDFFTDFQDYTRDGRAISGGLDVDANGPVGTILLDPILLGFSLESLDGVMTAALTASSQGSSSPNCDNWQLTGFGAETIAGFDYDFDILEALTISTCCAYPVSGEIAVTGPGIVPAFIDFGDGTCDDKATLTIAGETQTITLGYADR